MRFTIAIPVRNGENYLRKALASALRQTRQADEIVAVDDASSDSTAAILKSSEWAGRVKYFLNENPSGYADAVNRVMAKSTGDFVAVLDHDDLLHPEYLHHIELAARRFPNVKHFFSGCLYIDHDGRTTDQTPPPHSLEPVKFTGKEYAKKYLRGVVSNKHIHRCPGVTTARTLFLEKCSYRKEAGMIPDDDFFYRVGKFTNVVGISQPLASARLHGASLTSSKSLSRQLARDYVFETQYYQSTEGILDPNDIRSLHGLAARFITLSLYEGLLQENDQTIQEAISQRNRCEELIGPAFGREFPVWSLMMWMLVRAGNGTLARGYAKGIEGAVKIKNVVKR